MSLQVMVRVMLVLVSVWSFRVLIVSNKGGFLKINPNNLTSKYIIHIKKG